MENARIPIQAGTRADKDLDELSDETLTRIEAEDVTVPMAQTEVPRRAIGFV